MITDVMKLDRVRQEIEAASSIEELKDIRDKIEALRQYAQKRGETLEEQNKLAEVTLRCARKMGMLLLVMPKHPGAATLSIPGTALPEKLKDIGITRNDSSRCQIIATLPEPTFEQHIAAVKDRHEELTLLGLYQLAKRWLKEQEQEQRQDEERIEQEGRCDVYHCSVADLRNYIEPDSIDAIITDPPYPKEFLPVYTDLAKFAKDALKPGGSLIAMVGQSYLPEIIDMLKEHLTYHWMLAYLTPGAQSAHLWQKRVNSFWKPLLWFTKGEYQGDWVGDVCKSAVNDNDKRYHTWGQTESGMADIIERFTAPGQLVCDPFIGGGTTAAIALQLKRHFVGCDIDELCIQRWL